MSNNLILKESPGKSVSLKYYVIQISSNSTKSSKPKQTFISSWNMQRVVNCLITLSKEKGLINRKLSNSCNKSLPVLITFIKMGLFTGILNLKICCLIITKISKLSILDFLISTNQVRNSKLHVGLHVTQLLKWSQAKDTNVLMLIFGHVELFCTQCYVAIYPLKTPIRISFTKRSSQVISKCLRFYLRMQSRFYVQYWM